MLERVSWGVNGGSVRQVQKEGWNAYLQAQLHPGKASLAARHRRRRSTP